MTRARAVAVPLSLAAHAAILAGWLGAASLARGEMPALPAARPAMEWPTPPVFQTAPRARQPGPPAARRTSRRRAPALGAPLSPPRLADLAPAEALDDLLALDTEADATPCVGCVVDASGGHGALPAPGGTGHGLSGPPVRVGGHIREPVKVRHVPPSYPDLARAARVQGTVVLECRLTPDGRVDDVRVASGHPLLAPAAVRAVEQWLYRPTLLNGVPVPVLLTVTVTFALH